MATSKTLTPTNVTISIPEFTDQPDQRVNSNCIDKEADAINTLNSNLSFETITSGNFNSYTASGGKVKLYCGSNVNNFTNAPSGLSNYAFSLEVFQVGTDSTYTKQVLHFYGTTPTTFERQQYWSSGVQWGAWQQLITADKIKSHSYTSYTINTTKMSANASLSNCIVSGGICCLSVYAGTFTSEGVNQTDLITGLPKSKCQMGASIAGSNSANTAAIAGVGTTFWINSGGTSLNGHVGTGDNTRQHWITLVYPIDES